MCRYGSKNKQVVTQVEVKSSTQVKDVPKPVSSESDCAITHRIGRLKGSITEVLTMLVSSSVLEEYKTELKIIKEQLNKSPLL